MMHLVSNTAARPSCKYVSATAKSLELCVRPAVTDPGVPVPAPIAVKQISLGKSRLIKTRLSLRGVLGVILFRSRIQSHFIHLETCLTNNKNDSEQQNDFTVSTAVPNFIITLIVSFYCI